MENLFLWNDIYYHKIIVYWIQIFENLITQIPEHINLKLFKSDYKWSFT